jgi:hypothetical protein
MHRPTWTLLDPDTPRAVPLTDAVADVLLSGADLRHGADGERPAVDRLRLTGELIKLLEAGLLIQEESAATVAEMAVARS